MMNGNGVVLMSPPSFIPREKELFVQRERIIRPAKRIPMQKIDTVSVYGTEEQTPVEMIIYESGDGRLSGLGEEGVQTQYYKAPSTTESGGGTMQTILGGLTAVGTAVGSIYSAYEQAQAARRAEALQREQAAQLAQQQAQLAAQQAAVAAQAQAQAIQQAALPGQRVGQQAGLIPGIPNNVLLIGGVGLAALLLFLRR